MKVTGNHCINFFKLSRLKIRMIKNETMGSEPRVWQGETEYVFTGSEAMDSQPSRCIQKPETKY